MITRVTLSAEGPCLGDGSDGELRIARGIYDDKNGRWVTLDPRVTVRLTN